MRQSMEELKYLLKAKTKCIWIKTYEELEVINKIRNIITEEFPSMKLYSWSFFSGLQKEALMDIEKREDADPRVGLDKLFELIIKQQDMKSPKDENVYVIKDFHQLASTPMFVRGLRDAKERSIKANESYNPIIVVSPIIDIPLELEKLFTVLEYEVPSREEIEKIMNQFEQSIKKSNKGYILPSEEDLRQCTDLACGLTLNEIKNLAARSLVKYKTISPALFHEARLEFIKKSGVLEYKTATMSLADMGGNEAFKTWIDDVKLAMSKEAEDFGVEKPKGFLGLGVPGKLISV